MRSSCAVGAISCLLVAGIAADYRVTAQERLKHSNLSDQSPTIYNRPGDEVLKMPASQGTELGGTSWRLLKFHGSDDSNLTPDDKTKYTIAFGTDGRVTARIDCNRGMGTWKSLRPNQIQFGVLALTRAIVHLVRLTIRLQRTGSSCARTQSRI